MFIFIDYPQKLLYIIDDSVCEFTTNFIFEVTIRTSCLSELKWLVKTQVFS